MAAVTQNLGKDKMEKLVQSLESGDLNTAQEIMKNSQKDRTVDD